MPSAGFRQPAGLLLLAAWFGLLTGLGEVCLLAVKKFFLHRIIRLSPHVAWMAPVADLVFFAGFGLIFCLMARPWPRLVSLRMAAWAFAFLGFLSLLLMYDPLHLYAKLLLAAGLAVQTARLLAAHPQGFQALVRRTMGWMVALVVGLAAGVYGWQGLAERRALATLPSASPVAPNVLLIVLDTVRAQSLSLYGYARPTTPQLERLAKTGVRFERALSTAPWTLPSHASMFTGRFPHELSADWRIPLDATYPTLAEVLSARGYLTAGFVANMEYCTYEHGLHRGFVHYEDYLVSPEEIVLSSSLGRTIANSHRLRPIVGYYDILGRKTAATLNRDFLRWLSRQDRRPFFAFLNYYDAHEPYLPPEPFNLKFGPTTPRKDFLIRLWMHEGARSEKENMSPQEIQAELDAYEGAIAYLDQQLGLLFDELQAWGVLENTLVIITSDHGEEFSEHGLFTHGNGLYLTALHVPLVISFPSRVPAGKSVREAVSLHDVPATVIELLRLEDEARFPGTSLARYWDDARDSDSRVTNPLLSEVNLDSSAAKWYSVAKGDMKSLIVNPYHYIKNGDGREELYNFENDPLEQRDLAYSEEGRRMLEQLRTSLETILARN